MIALPALLTDSETDFLNQVMSLSPFFTYFQIDVTDGIFVPSRTLTIDQVASILKKMEPNKLADLTFDFDLMVADYKNALVSLSELKNHITIGNVFIHVAALSGQPIPVSNDFTIGIAIDPSDDIEALHRQYNINLMPSIQIMTVTPGFQGSPFLEKELYKIEQLRLGGYRNKIYIDGSVNDTTIPIILSKKYQPDFAGIGSFLSKAPDIKQRAEQLQNMLR